MKKKLFKIIIIIPLLIFLLNVFMPQSVYAEEEFSFKKVLEDYRNFINRAETTGTTDLTPEIAKNVQPVINTLYWVGVSIVIGAAMFLGVEYFKSTGNPKEKAEIQKKLIGFLISSAVLIAAYPIWSFLVKFVSSLLE